MSQQLPVQAGLIRWYKGKTTVAFYSKANSLLSQKFGFVLCAVWLSFMKIPSFGRVYVKKDVTAQQETDWFRVPLLKAGACLSFADIYSWI